MSSPAGDTGPPGPSRQDWQAAVIERIVVETPTVRSFTLRPRIWRPFLPGQHVDVRLTAPDGYEARRSYSVASPPEQEGTLDLAVERLETGEVSTFLHDVAAVGDAVEIRGPFAEHFVWRSESDGSVLLAGGGSGIAPLMSMVRHRAFVTASPPMLLLYSARTWDLLLFRDELLAHERAQHGFRSILCLTRDQARRPGDYSRRIDAAIAAEALAALGEAPRLSFICGSNSFVGTVADTLVALGLPAATIRTERFGAT